MWPWRSRSMISKNNRDLNQGVLYLWSKFCDLSFNERWVIVRTSSCLTHTHIRTHRPTDAADDNTWRPKLALGNTYIFEWICIRFPLSFDKKIISFLIQSSVLRNQVWWFKHPAAFVVLFDIVSYIVDKLLQTKVYWGNINAFWIDESYMVLSRAKATSLNTHQPGSPYSQIAYLYVDNNGKYIKRQIRTVWVSECCQQDNILYLFL